MGVLELIQKVESEIDFLEDTVTLNETEESARVLSLEINKAFLADLKTVDYE